MYASWKVQKDDDVGVEKGGSHSRTSIGKLITTAQCYNSSKLNKQEVYLQPIFPAAFFAVYADEVYVS